MRLLVDTHILLWSRNAPDRLARARPMLADGDNELLVSAVVAWEIAIKYALGRLVLPLPPDRYLPDRLRALHATPISVTHQHALGVATLPHLHGDPFDRLLVSQAQQLGATLVTADAVLAGYDVETLLV